MNLELRRRPSFGGATVGELFDVSSGLDHHAGEDRICYMLEDQVREIPGVPVEKWKVPGQTAIPCGRYRVVITMSARFKRPLPLLLNVPGYEGIRWHPGNYASDTEGCQLPGLDVVNNRWMSQSAAACDKLFRYIAKALDRGEEVWVEVLNAPAVH